MRSLLARLALVGLVGIALAGCGASNGTTLPAGGVNANSGGGAINTPNGIGAPPLGLIASVLIDNGTVAAASAYVGGNSFATDTANLVQALQDPVGAAVPSVPNSPGAPTPSQATDTGSHAVVVNGDNATVVKLRFSGAVPNLTYQFGTAGNSTFFNYSNIIAHFSFGTKANGSVVVGGTATAGDTVTIWINIGAGPVNVGYTATAADTPATIAAALVANINANATVGPKVATGVYAWVNPANASNVLLAAAATGVAGNTITYFASVQGALTETATPAAATALAGGTASTAATLGTFSAWAIELVGNGTAAGPGSPAATYDVRVTCAATAVGNSLNRFVCGPLPAYGAASNLAPTSGLQGAGTYNVPTEASFAAAAGAFTPVNPQMIVELVYTSATNPVGTANPWIDYIYAAQ